MLALGIGVQRLVVELDAKVVIGLITSTSGSNKPYSPLLNDCRYLLRRFLQTRVVHVFREGNRCADALARMGSNMAEEFLVFDNPPSPDVLYFVNTDAAGVLYNRSSFCDLIVMPVWLSTGKQKPEPKSAEEHIADGMENGLRFTDCRWRRGLSATNINFTHSPFWVQIWGLPFELMSDDVGKKFGNNIGKFIEVDQRARQSNQAKFMRIGVDLQLDKPLKRGDSPSGIDEVIDAIPTWVSEEMNEGLNRNFTRKERKLWHLNLPAKIKIFAWRACVNGLPTMEAIYTRGISQTKICPVCRNEAETLDYAPLDCAFSSLVWCLWSENPLSIHGIKKSFLDSTIFILAYATLQDLELFFFIAWAIWFSRNRLVHEGCGLPFTQVWHLAKSSVDDFACSATWDLSQSRAPLSSWSPPPPGFHKINVNGASSESDSCSSVGVVIRDCWGQVVAALCKPLQACYPAELMEIMAIEQGVLLAQELQLPSVIVESDSSNAILAIHEKATGSSFGHLIQEILQANESFETCHFKHLSRNFNSVAHELAQHARRTRSQYLWKGVMPPVVASFLQADMM
ncbi:hypothetical protein SO802_013807 [Lithocarpus litseifolius]|uniref:RNase H type-1 domain-containing protein n=1 Tax=Lithocarpus litseifolius TaxID=425828 RepID=A0AAW2DC47_9ROSI